jgi:hypothetical protein
MTKKPKRKPKGSDWPGPRIVRKLGRFLERSLDAVTRTKKRKVTKKKKK